MADSLGVQDKRRYEGQNQIHRNLNCRVNQHILKAAPQSLILERSDEIVEAREGGATEKGLLEEAEIKRVEHRDDHAEQEDHHVWKTIQYAYVLALRLAHPGSIRFRRCICHSFSLSS